MFTFAKKISIVVIIFSSVLGSFALPGAVHAAGARVPLIRLYNPAINDHFYTNSRTEADAAKGFGYRIEGDMGYLYLNAEANTQAVYRLWNPSARKHFYTTNSLEADAAVRGGFLREGAVGYMPYAGQNGGGITVHRLYNPKLHKHFFTTNWAEVQLLKAAGYNWEGELGGGLYPTAGDAVYTPSDFIPVSSPTAGFNVGEYRSTPFQFQYKGSQVIYPTVSYTNMPAGLTGSIISPSASAIANNDIFYFTISGTLNTAVSTNVQATLQSNTGYSETFNIAITSYGQSNPLTILGSSTLPSGMTGQPYSYQFQVSGGTAPYTWEPYSDNSFNVYWCCMIGINSNGLFSSVGVPEHMPNSGTYQIGVRVRDAAGNTTQRVFTYTINGNTLLQLDTPTPLPDGYVSNGYYQTMIKAKGGNPAYQYTLLGVNYPGGLSLDADGTLRLFVPPGTNSSLYAGTWQIGIKVTDQAGASAFAYYQLTIR